MSGLRRTCIQHRRTSPEWFLGPTSIRTSAAAQAIREQEAGGREEEVVGITTTTMATGGEKMKQGEVEKVLIFSFRYKRRYDDEDDYYDHDKRRSPRRRYSRSRSYSRRFVMTQRFLQQLFKTFSFTVAPAHTAVDAQEVLEARAVTRVVQNHDQSRDNASAAREALPEATREARAAHRDTTNS